MPRKFKRLTKARELTEPVVVRARPYHERKERELTLAQVAAKTNISIATIARLEHGEEPLLRTAVALAKFYRLNVYDLFRDLLTEENTR